MMMGLFMSWVGLIFPPALVSGDASSIPNKPDLSITTKSTNQVAVYLPLIISLRPLSPRVNLPLLDTEVNYAESAVFWFGQITPTENYVDIRIGYNSSDLLVNITVFDRLLWYDPEPSIVDLTSWDAAEIFLDLNPNTSTIDQNTYRFVGQLNWWEPRQGYQAAYQGGVNGWQYNEIPFTTVSGWRGNAPNDDWVDHGWLLYYTIPFSSLGRTSAPLQGTTWRIGVTLYDRDDQIGTYIQPKVWPIAMRTTKTDNWATLSFGLPTALQSQTAPTGSVIIRQGENGVQVPDGMVGGAMNCGDDYQLDRWNAWGLANYAGSEQVNVQNEEDVSDWVCFSKYYVTFPLDNLPTDKQIISATLTLHIVGNAGGGIWGPAPDSLIQVLTIIEEWKEESLNWNNAPLALENVSRAWVHPISDYPGAPGVPQDWDLTYAVQQAYSHAIPLRLVLYSADVAYHTGKYFSSSDLQDLDPTGRPTLRVIWGDMLEEK